MNCFRDGETGKGQMPIIFLVSTPSLRPESTVEYSLLRLMLYSIQSQGLSFRYLYNPTLLCSTKVQHTI